MQLLHRCILKHLKELVIVILATLRDVTSAFVALDQLTLLLETQNFRVVF